MRTLTAPATLTTGRAATAPVLLVTMTTVSGTVFRLSDYNRVIGGVEYLGLIQNPRDLSESLNDFDGGGSPATATLVLSNALPVGGKARFSDLIQTPRNLTGTYDFRNARVDIDRLEQGQALADAVRLQSFYLEAPNEIGDSLVTLQMSDLAQKIEDALPITKVTRARFPTAQVIGQEIRRPFGILKNVKAIPVEDGAASNLAAALTDTPPTATITLVDGTNFPPSGTALIDGEFVTWAGKSDVNTLRSITRNALASTIAAHDVGATVLEVKATYTFVAGEGARHAFASTRNYVVNPDFAANLTGWTTSDCVWDAGRARFPTSIGSSMSQSIVAVPNGVYTITVDIVASSASHFRLNVGSTVLGSELLASGALTAGAQSFQVTATATALLSIQFIYLGSGGSDGLLDNVSVVATAGFATLPITALTNIRVNGRAARTSPVATANDATLDPARTFGTIRFTPADSVAFHSYPGASIDTAVATVSTGQLSEGVTLTATRTITPSASVEAMPRNRQFRGHLAVTNGSGPFTWFVKRRKANGVYVTLAQGDQTKMPFEFSDSRDYDSADAEEFLLSGTGVQGTSNIIVSLYFDAYDISYDSAGSGGGSTAQAVIGEVICDVQGIQDDSLGTFTGTAATLFENPTDVFAVVLRALYGVSYTAFDASWAVTRALHASAAYRWAGLLGSQQFSALRRTFSEQARARCVLASGMIGFRFRSYRPSADVVFRYGSAVPAERVAQALTVKLTSPTEMIGGMTARYAFDDAKGDYQKSLIFGDPVAAAVLPPMDLAFVSDETTARDVGAYWYGHKRRQRFSIDGTAWHNALALEQGDRVAVGGYPAMIAHGDANLIFDLLRKTDRGSRDGLGQIAFGGIEATIEGDVGPEDASLMWGSRGLLARNNSGTPNTKIDVTAAAALLRNSANVVVIRHNPGSLTVDLGAAGPAANSRDQAGAHTASTWVHVYWIWDSVNAILALTSSAVAPPTGPTLPTGFTYWGYVGAFYFNGSSQVVRTTICGSWASRTTVEALAAAVTDNTEHSIDGTAIWPPNAMRIGGTWGVILSTAGDSADLRPESGVDSGLHLETPGATTTGFGGPFQINVTGQTLWYIQSVNGSKVWRLEINQYELPNGG